MQIMMNELGTSENITFATILNNDHPKIWQHKMLKIDYNKIPKYKQNMLYYFRDII